ncbi:helix-turn-helix domain-containing protein [Virgibacillus soli]|uniref:Helix-turn-helix domain-containing protein n=1 Tax=Paracerasibacillus soli TaxID=480284 RepID=A0ABU5CUA2_9BACI|nr:helix-turn-helix domain-containing protein [Virgibacillus soli]MDY0409950.1 helix-turn-helix domain-containing protein [Virgibacillus soli]
MNKEYLSQTESTYKALQSFESVEEMNESIKAHKQAHELSQTERDILDAISRYACKYKGVCYLSKQKIAEQAGYKSRRTAIRACNRLEALGIIEQHETKRIKGDRRQSTNIIVIKPANAEPDTAASHGIKTSAKANTNNTYKETAEQPKPSADNIIKRGLKNAIPAPIYSALEPFFDGQALYDTYGILLRAKARIDRRIPLETYAERYIDAFYNVVRLHKSGKVRSMRGLLYVAWERLSAEISRQINAKMLRLG